VIIAQIGGVFSNTFDFISVRYRYNRKFKRNNYVKAWRKVANYKLLTVMLFKVASSRYVGSLCKCLAK